MNIAIDESPLRTGHSLQHKVRGSGFYVENLKSSLLKYYSNNKYTFFIRGEKLSKDIDLVHYPYFEPFFLTLPFRKKYKIVVTVHDLTPLVFPKQFPSGIKGKVKWEIQKRALRKADAIITDSQSSKDDIVKFTGISPEKVYVIYLAASEEFKKMENGKLKMENFRKKYNLPDKFVLYVGDVTPNKNLPRLIEAVQKINIPLVMVGAALANKDFDRYNSWNQDLVNVQDMIKNDMNIICLGFVPTEDLVILYNIATVFIMPSLHEGFGLPILEAMNCGCPVVTSKSGSLKEITLGAAWYIEPEDINSIANGIEKVFNDRVLREELSKSGLIQAKKFSWKKTAEETMQVYKKL